MKIMKALEHVIQGKIVGRPPGDDEIIYADVERYYLRLDSSGDLMLGELYEGEVAWYHEGLLASDLKAEDWEVETSRGISGSSGGNRRNTRYELPY